MFLRAIWEKVENLEKYVFAFTAFHNNTCQTENATYTPGDFIDSYSSDDSVINGDWTSQVIGNGHSSIKKLRGSGSTINPAKLIDLTNEEFWNTTCVEWNLICT